MGEKWFRRSLVTVCFVMAVASGAGAQNTRAYVANRGAASVTVVDVEKNRISKVKIDKAPVGVAAPVPRR